MLFFFSSFPFFSFFLFLTPRPSGPTTRSSSRIEKSNFGGNQETVNPINVELAQLFLTLRSGKVSLVEPESLYNSICKSLPAFYGFQQHV